MVGPEGNVICNTIVYEIAVEMKLHLYNILDQFKKQEVYQVLIFYVHFSCQYKVLV